MQNLGICSFFMIRKIIGKFVLKFFFAGKVDLKNVLVYSFLY